MSDQKKEEKIESLIKIKGIARKNAEYLLKIGINSPEELAQQKPSGLFAKFQELQKEGTISYETSERVCKQMIEEANAGNYEYAYAEEKYESLIDRSFENKLRLLLYMKCIKEENPDFIVDEEIFTKIDSNLEKEYKQIYRDMNKIREINKEIKDWKNNKQNDRKSIRLREIFEKSFKNSLPWGTFKKNMGKTVARTDVVIIVKLKKLKLSK